MLLWVAKLKKVFIFSYCANKCCNSNVVTSSEVEVSSNSSKARCRWYCTSLPRMQSPKKDMATQSQFRQLLPWAQELLCALVLLGWQCRNFGIWLYWYPSSMFHVLWLYRDVFKSFNVTPWSSFIVWCVVIATILNKRIYLQEFVTFFH